MKKIFLFMAFLMGCSPVTVSRIGPPVSPKDAKCEILVLPPGQVPENPHRDVGQVDLRNCTDYQTYPCKKWLMEAACSLGGDVAYLLEPIKDGRPDHLLSDVVFSVTVAAYISSLYPMADFDRGSEKNVTDCEEDTEKSDSSGVQGCLVK